AVREVVDVRGQELRAQAVRNLLRELVVRPSGDQYELLVARGGDRLHLHDSFSALFASSVLPGRFGPAESVAGSPAAGSAASCAARAAGVPGRFAATHPSMMRWRPSVIVSAPAGTSSRMTL